MGVLLREWRESRKMTQAGLAKLLNWTQPYVSQLESGRAKLQSVDQLWHVQRTLDIPPEELGLAAVRFSGMPEEADLPPGYIGTGAREDDVEQSQRRWRMVRRYLDSHRAELTSAAARLYPEADRVGGSSIITQPAWMLAEPLEFDDINLAWTMDAPTLEVGGDEQESVDTRPLADTGVRYERYSRAMRDLARPRLFENRPGYRLLNVDWTGGAQLEFAYTAYFESVIDVSTALAHELAEASMVAVASGACPGMADLPFRSLVGDPFDLSRRALLPSIDTLTIRKAPDGSASFLLHYRDPASVATASSLYHLMPAGVFQPSSVAPWHQANDFSLWRSSMREYAEEFLNIDEADGSSLTPIDYDGLEPYRTMNAAKAAGQFRMWCFGIGLDPLTLCGEILSVAVIDAEVFDRVFAGLVVTNQEGSLVTANPETPAQGIPFTEDHVRRLLDAQPLAAPAAACLELAWRHRGRLLG